jgi:hypothetical protein
MDAIGTNAETLLIADKIDIGQGYPLPKGTLIVPANVTLQFLRGGAIHVEAGKTLIIYGPIDAGNHRIFTPTAFGAATAFYLVFPR